jgi:hypothetical protein
MNVNKKVAGMPLWMIGILLIGGLFYFGVVTLPTGSVSPVGGVPNQEQIQSIDTTSGTSATVYINAYDLSANSETEVYPTYYIYDAQGNALVDGAGANNTTTFVGQVLNFYGGGASYYVEPKVGYKVTAQSVVSRLDAVAIPSESNMQVVGRDYTGTALTADDNATNTADYSISLGASQTESVQIELQTAVANREYHLKAICTYAFGDVSEFKLVEGGDWTEVAMPKEIKDATLTQVNDTGSSLTGSYDRCYVYKEGTTEVIKMPSWAKKSFNFVVESSTVDPTANTGDVFGAIFMDGSWAKGKDGKIYFDFYRHDDNGRVSEVGVAETEASPQGLDIGLMIEAQ